VFGSEPKARGELIEHLAGAIESIRRPHPVRVCLDGPPAAGKTTLADELALALRGRGREVVRASIDGFLRPQAERYRRGEESAEGNYEDSFDYTALHHVLLDPLGPGGSRAYRPAVFDRLSDVSLPGRSAIAPEDAILLFDGVFLLRPELAHVWDFRILVSVEFDECLRRALIRDISLYGSRQRVERRYRNRYIPGQRLYLEAARPADVADVIVGNDDPAHPTIEAVGPAATATSPVGARHVMGGRRQSE
jgi:uridine kinase